MRLFGCKLWNEVSLIDGKFNVEVYEHFLCFFPDPPHMMKLSRNVLANLEIFVHEGMYIEWKYIVKLNEIQMDEGFRFANKLSNHHIQFQRHKMIVSVAVQTFSSSIADTLESLLRSVKATLKFLREFSMLI